jgi:hypothetical protein
MAETREWGIVVAPSVAENPNLAEILQVIEQVPAGWRIASGPRISTVRDLIYQHDVALCVFDIERKATDD